MSSTRSLFVPLIAIVIGTFMVILDTTVVNVALATLGHAFGANLSLLQWVISAYLLAQAAVIPLAGWLSDRFGARRVYLVSLVLFTLGSVLCGLAISGEMLIATRVLQGLGGKLQKSDLACNAETRLAVLDLPERQSGACRRRLWLR